MDDLILRQAAIDAIKALWNDAPSAQHVSAMFDCEDVIRALPSAQPEIIHCRDCKNWDKTWTNNFLPNYHYCPMVDGVRKDNFYCADAERREE